MNRFTILRSFFFSSLRLSLFISFFTLILISCVEEIEIFSESQDFLVIEGSITTNLEYQSVIIYETSPFNDRKKFIEDAFVLIVDEQGYEIPFWYTEFGVYKSLKEVNGNIGSRYRLLVTINEDSYESDYTIIPEPINIDSTYFTHTDGNVYFYSDLSLMEERSYFLWESNFIYSVQAPLALVDFNTNPREKGICETIDLSKQREYCWLSNKVHYFQLYDNQFIGSQWDKNLIATLPLNNKFDIGLLLQSSVMVFDEQYFKYLNTIKSQLENTNTIFEAPNYEIRGNIKKVGSDDLVLGYFVGKAISHTNLFVRQFQRDPRYPVSCEKDERGCINDACFNCNLLASDVSSQPPEDWPFEFAQTDFDKDGISDDEDNCYYTFNPDQIDMNNNGIGDACETRGEIIYSIENETFNSKYAGAWDRSEVGVNYLTISGYNNDFASPVYDGKLHEYIHIRFLKTARPSVQTYYSDNNTIREEEEVRMTIGNSSQLENGTCWELVSYYNEPYVTEVSVLESNDQFVSGTFCHVINDEIKISGTFSGYIINERKPTCPEY